MQVKVTVQEVYANLIYIVKIGTKETTEHVRGCHQQRLPYPS